MADKELEVECKPLLEVGGKKLTIYFCLNDHSNNLFIII